MCTVGSDTGLWQGSVFPTGQSLGQDGISIIGFVHPSLSPHPFHHSFVFAMAAWPETRRKRKAQRLIRHSHYFFRPFPRSSPSKRQERMERKRERLWRMSKLKVPFIGPEVGLVYTQASKPASTEESSSSSRRRRRNRSRRRRRKVYLTTAENRIDFFF